MCVYVTFMALSFSFGFIACMPLCYGSSFIFLFKDTLYLSEKHFHLKAYCIRIWHFGKIFFAEWEKKNELSNIQLTGPSAESFKQNVRTERLYLLNCDPQRGSDSGPCPRTPLLLSLYEMFSISPFQHHQSLTLWLQEGKEMGQMSSGCAQQADGAGSDWWNLR